MLDLSMQSLFLLTFQRDLLVQQMGLSGLGVAPGLVAMRQEGPVDCPL